MTSPRVRQTLSRRQFLAASAMGVSAVALTGSTVVGKDAAATSVVFGLIADVHSADIPTNLDRHYRDSKVKLAAAVETFNCRRVDFAVELGDFFDVGAGKEAELGYLRDIGRVFEQFHGPRHYVLGNHCVARLTKDKFLARCGATIKRSYYSFDHGPYHFVVLDADFNPDETPYASGNFDWTKAWIPLAEQKWLADDLKKAGNRKTVVFIHQNLHNEKEPAGVKNAPEVRRILESAGNVLAVFQGHAHEGSYTKINGIHYCTLRAMVVGPGLENNAYAIVTLDGERITFEGFGRQKAWMLR